MLDQTWRYFTSPEALAVVKLWLASATDPELVPTLRGIEERLDQVVDETSRALFPDAVEEPRFPSLIQSTYFLIRGLISAVPVIGIEAADRRWRELQAVGTGIDGGAGGLNERSDAQAVAVACSGSGTASRSVPVTALTCRNRIRSASALSMPG